nr:hypothetical protein [Tanacetum cinerariifolium]
MLFPEAGRFDSIIRFSVFFLLWIEKDTIDTITSVLTQKELDAFYVKWHVLASVEPQLLGHNDTIKEPLGKNAYDVIDSVIAAAKMSHFEILCLVLGGIPTVGMLQDIANLEFVEVLSKNLPGFRKYLKSSDSFKVKTGERTLVKGEILILKETEDQVIPPSCEIILLMDRNIHDEIEDAAKYKGKKKRVAFKGSLLHANKGGGTLTNLKKLVDQSVLRENFEIGSSTVVIDAFVSSSVTPSPAPEGDGVSDSDHEILLSDALTASRTRDEKRKNAASMSLVAFGPTAAAVGSQSGYLTPTDSTSTVDVSVVINLSSSSFMTMFLISAIDPVVTSSAPTVDVLDYQVSDLQITGDDVHNDNDMFDSSVLDKPEDHQASAP